MEPDRRFMAAALALARRRIGQVGARPAVGALVVGAASGVVLGRGATGPGGRPHAETVALEEAERRWGAEALRGATAYVTLEPCAHWGRTPPCTDALIAAGIARVVAPVEDPDPRVSGRGFAALREAGIAVETGLMATEARAVNRGFLARIGRGRPWLTLKFATTLDGRIATASGESRWITGSAARARVHLMRLGADAVMIGAGTARTDDPMLDVRGFGAQAAQPVRVVMDSGLSLDPASRLVRTAGKLPLVLVHAPGAAPANGDALRAAGARTIEVGAGADGRADPAAALDALGAEGLNTVLCEGGGTLAAALLAAGLVDEIAHFAAGRVLGSEAVPAVGRLALPRLVDAPAFELAGVERVGGDMLGFWRRADA